MGEGLPGQELQGLVVVHVAVLDDAAVAVVGVLAHADVGDDRQPRHLFLQGPDRLLNDAVLGVGVAANGVLGLGDAEQDHRRHSQFINLLGLGHDMLDGLLVNARHGGNFFPDARAEGGKHRIDQVGGGEGGLADHPAENLLAPDPARSEGGIEHGV